MASGLRPYPYEASRKIKMLVKTLTAISRRDPEQEVMGIAIPVLDAVITYVRDLAPDDPVAKSIADVISPDSIAIHEGVRVSDALLVAEQLQAIIGSPPLVVY